MTAFTDKVLLVCSECDGLFLKALAADGATHFACGGFFRQLSDSEQLDIFGHSRIVTIKKTAGAP